MVLRKTWDAGDQTRVAVCYCFGTPLLLLFNVPLPLPPILRGICVARRGTVFACVRPLEGDVSSVTGVGITSKGEVCVWGVP